MADMWAYVAAVMVAAGGFPRTKPRRSAKALGIRMKFIEPSIMDEPWFHPLACAGILSLFIVEAAAIFV